MTPMTGLDLTAIQARQSAAAAILTGIYDGDPLQDGAILDQVVTEDVPALLLDLEARTSAADEGYVRGLRAAASWLRMWDQNLPGFDRDTCRTLARGMASMAGHAQERLGVDPDRPDEREVLAAHAATFQEAGR